MDKVKMRRSLLDGDEPEIEKPKLIDFLRPLIGVVLGVSIFWAFEFIGQDVRQARMNAIAFLTPGILAVMFLKLYYSMDIVMGTPQFNILVAAISSVPFAIFGALLSSRRRKVRIATFELFIIYGIFCMIGLLAVSKLYPLLQTP